MDFDVYQGRTRRITIGPVTRPDGTTMALTSTTIRFMVKSSLTANDTNPTIDYRFVVDGAGAGVSTPAGAIEFGRPDPTDSDTMIDTTASSGYVTITINDDDTRDVGPGTLPYEVVLIDGTRVYQLRAGNITIVDTLIEDPETLL